ncbi:MAG: cytochrome c [Myxococcaceae bacterium]|nr:cytochrome c [Myxococcaceae bacterium]
MRTALLLTCWLLTNVDGGTPDSPRPKKEPGTLSARASFPKMARDLLRRRMHHHAEDLPDLLLSVTLLQRDDARFIAAKLAAEPRLTRPLPGDEDTLNRLLPEKFFVLQDELRSRAQAVSQAAAKGDDQALAQSFGRLTETCVACHSAFLQDHPASE